MAVKKTSHLYAQAEGLLNSRLKDPLQIELNPQWDSTKREIRANFRITVLNPVETAIAGCAASLSYKDSTGNFVRATESATICDSEQVRQSNLRGWLTDSKFPSSVPAGEGVFLVFVTVLTLSSGKYQILGPYEHKFSYGRN